MHKKCPHCDKELSTKHLAEHIRSQHPALYSKQPFKGDREQCVYCEKQYALATRAKHYNLHHPGRQIPLPWYRDRKNASGKSVQQRRIGPASKYWPLMSSSSQPSHSDRCKEVLSLTVQRIEQLETLLASSTDPRTRAHNELPLFKDLAESAKIGRPISPQQYFQIVRHGNPLHEEHDYKYVVCNNEEARKILRHSSPWFPIVILNSFKSNLGLEGGDGFLELLMTRSQADVQRYDKPGTAAVKMSTSHTVELFRNRDGWPLNLLNLERMRLEDFPECVSGLQPYTILRDLNPARTAGKQARYYHREATNSSTFMLCAKSGAFHLPHIDQLGFMTIVRVQDGRKAWLIWPRLSIQELITWQKGSHGPEKQLFILDLQEGDVLIQPAQRVHAPFSPQNVLMDGYMFWDSRRLTDIGCYILFNRIWPNATNENEPREAQQKFLSAGELWFKDSQLWPWEDESRKGFFTIISDKLKTRVTKDDFDAIVKFWD